MRNKKSNQINFGGPFGSANISNGRIGSSIVLTPNLNAGKYFMVSSSAPLQQAHEGMFQQSWHGIFTYYLCQELDRTMQTASYVMDHITPATYSMFSSVFDKVSSHVFLRSRGQQVPKGWDRFSFSASK